MSFLFPIQPIHQLYSPFYNPGGVLYRPKARVFLKLLGNIPTKNKINLSPEVIEKLKELIKMIKEDPSKHKELLDKLKKDYKGSKDSKKSDVPDLTNKENLEAELKGSKDMINTLESDKKSLEDKLKELVATTESEKKESQKKTDELNKKKQELEETNKILDEEHTSTLNQLSEFRKAKSEKDEKLKELEKLLQTTESEKTQLTSEVKIANNNGAKCNQDLNNKNNEIKKLKDRLNELVATTESEKGNSLTLTKLINDKTKILDELTAEKNKLIAEKEQLTQTINECTIKLQSAQDNLSKRGTKFIEDEAKLKVELSDLKNEKKKIDDKLTIIKEEVKKITKSESEFIKIREKMKGQSEQSIKNISDLETTIRKERGNALGNIAGNVGISYKKYDNQDFNKK
jgi:chromosome segregation ATPase